MNRWKVLRAQRLIDAIRDRIPPLSLRALKKHLESNGCRINGRIERFGSAALRPGDWIELAPIECEEISRAPTILFEDEQLLVLDKPVGSVCTDEAFGKRLKQKVWLCHRLDKDTTGVLLLAKSHGLALELQGLFKERQVEKTYIALVDGLVAKSEGVIRSNLAKKRSFQGQTIWGSAHSGLFAETHWSRLKTLSDATLLECKPMTGRTHQLRVHLAEMGHPILVDRQYASQFRSKIRSARPLLHAKALSFSWRGRQYAFCADLPADLSNRYTETTYILTDQPALFFFGGQTVT